MDVRHLGEQKLLELMPQEVMLCRIHEGVDPVKELIPVKPVSHYTMGGIDVDNNFQINGLNGAYAVGECSNAKVHGANRLGGNSLLEIVAFGMEVAKIAVDNLKDIEPPNSFQLEKDKRFIEDIFKRDFSKNFYQLENNLGEKFYKYAGIIRREDELNLLKQKLEAINSLDYGILDKTKKFNTNLIDFLQFLNLLEIGKIVVESALLRKESRGAHFRSDYPKSSNKFIGEFIFFREDGKLKQIFKEIKNENIN
jgi:succinate dehydrogenase / fumarate reductase flavoprotein subunit